MNWNPPPITVHGRLRPILTAVAILAALLVVSSLRASTTPSYSVPSTIANNCSTDVTSQLLTWIGSVPNNSTLTFTAGACYKIEGTLEIRGRSGLTIDGNGATFRSFNAPDDQRSIWRVIDSSNFAFVNMTLRGSYTNGGVHDVSLQHSHGIDLRGVSAEIANVTGSDLAGDCFYFGLGYSSALTRSSGSVHDSTCSRIGRNAVSVTAGDDIRIEHVTTDQIGFVAFDIEPNTQPGFGSRRVTVTNNAIGSYYLYAYAIVDNGAISDQYFTNNRITAPKGLRIGVISFDASRPTGVTVTGNVATAATWSGAMEIQDVEQLVVTGNTVPLSGGTMATVDSSCGVNVSGNSYPGGTKEVQLTNTPVSCVVTAPTPAPSVGSFSPSSGPVGTNVTVSGSAFTGATKVSFNGAAASFTVNSASQLTATVPAGATSGSISVVTPAGTGTSSSSFTVSAPAAAPTPAPSVGSFSPSSGPVGTNVTVSGSAFTGATKVSFNGLAASFTVNSASQLTATVPAGATSGSISVVTPAGTGTSSASFTVSVPTPAPSIGSFSPSSGPVGTNVTVSGSAFTGATKVSFNGVAASFTVDSGSQLTATVPAGATSGSISVVTPAGTGTSSSSFTVSAPTPAPSIGSFSPSSGPVGTKVTVNGSAFTGATSVSFNGLAASFTVISATRITVIVPAGAGNAKITVKSAGGTATSQRSFTTKSPPKRSLAGVTRHAAPVRQALPRGI